MTKKLSPYTPLAAVVASLVVGAAPAAPPQTAPGRKPTVDDDVATIREKASSIGKYRELLNDRDQNVRMEAFQFMARSTDPAMQEVAYEMGFSSAEGSVRTLALRERLTSLHSINIELGELVGGNAAFATSVGTQIHYTIVASDPAHGAVFISNRAIKDPSEAWGTLSASGSVVQIDVRKTAPACWGQFRLGDGGDLTGLLTCANGAQATLKAHAKIY